MNDLYSCKFNIGFFDKPKASNGKNKSKKQAKDYWNQFDSIRSFIWISVFEQRDFET